MWEELMKYTCLTILCFALVAAVGQTTIRRDVESAIVWSGPQCRDSSAGFSHDALCDRIPSAHPEASSFVVDPLTGHSLRKLSHEGIDVISGLRSYPLNCGWSDCREAYVASFTIVNNTDHPVNVDGNSFSSTLSLPTPKEIQKWWGKKAKPGDFLPSSGVISPGQSARVLGVMVAHHTEGGTNITKWNNNTPCFVIPIRYSMRIGGKDFVFPWLAPTNGTFDVVPQWDY